MVEKLKQFLAFRIDNAALACAQTMRCETGEQAAAYLKTERAFYGRVWLNAWHTFQSYGQLSQAYYDRIFAEVWNERFSRPELVEALTEELRRAAVRIAEYEARELARQEARRIEAARIEAEREARWQAQEEARRIEAERIQAERLERWRAEWAQAEARRIEAERTKARQKLNAKKKRRAKAKKSTPTKRAVQEKEEEEARRTARKLARFPIKPAAWYRYECLLQTAMTEQAESVCRHLIQDRWPLTEFSNLETIPELYGRK